MIPTRPPRLRWENLPAARLQADAALQADWNRMNGARGNLSFLDADAIGAALACFGSGDERLLVGRTSDAACAMFVLRRSGAGRWETFQPSQLPLGAWVAAPEWPILALAEALLRGPLATALVVSVTQVDPRHVEAPADGPAHTRDDYIETAWVDIAGSFDAYWAQRGKNLRNNMRKQRSKLAADGVGAELVELRDAADMAGAIARYGALESAGWKSAGGTAIHPGNAQGRFYTRLLEDAARRGEAVVYEFRFDGRPMAIHLCLQRAGEIVILKTTYDETVDKSLSPALLLHQDEMQRLFDGGRVQRLEYYGRLMEWHTRWTDNKRALYHLTCYRWPWLKRLKRAMSTAPRAEVEGSGQHERVPLLRRRASPR